MKVSFSVIRCPSCGAPVSGTQCEYCKTTLNKHYEYDMAEKQADLVPHYVAAITSVAQPEPVKPKRPAYYDSLSMYASCGPMMMTSCYYGGYDSSPFIPRYMKTWD